jgi:putative DNA primase/helicase
LVNGHHPTLISYGANRALVSRARSVVKKNEEDLRNVQTALAEDILELEKAIDKKGDVSLIVIDPVTNYLGKLSMNKENEMRDLLMPLADLAQRKNICIVTVGHLNKKTNNDGVQLLDRVMGAAAFHGVARQTFLFGDDPE